MAEDVKLAGCPFCGGPAKMEVVGTIRDAMTISCTLCGASLESNDVRGLTLPEHYAWNTRRAPSDLVGALERCVNEVRRALDMHFDSHATGCAWNYGDPYDLSLIDDTQEYAEAERMMGCLEDARAALSRHKGETA